MKELAFKDLLNDGFEKLNLNVNSKQLDMLWEFMNFLQSENKKYNLTGIEKLEEMISRHILDSAVLPAMVDITNWDDILDVGTGAGFPGMVLKILYPDLKVTLMDSRLKRIMFIKSLLARLKIESTGIAVIRGRAEELGHDPNLRGNFNPVVSRAVAPLNTLLEYTLPFVKKNGLLFTYKSQDFEKELKDADKALTILGAKEKDRIKVIIPGISRPRVVLSFRKNKNTPEKYPRRTGIPKKNPL